MNALYYPLDVLCFAIVHGDFELANLVAPCTVNMSIESVEGVCAGRVDILLAWVSLRLFHPLVRMSHWHNSLEVKYREVWRKNDVQKCCLIFYDNLLKASGFRVKFGANLTHSVNDQAHKCLGVGQFLQNIASTVQSSPDYPQSLLLFDNVVKANLHLLLHCCCSGYKPENCESWNEKVNNAIAAKRDGLAELLARAPPITTLL